MSTAPPPERPDPAGCRLLAGGRLLVWPAEEILGLRPWAEPTPLPGTPSWLLGLLPWGGASVAVLDLAAWLGGLASPPGPDARLVQVGDGLALWVEKVLGRDDEGGEQAPRLALQTLRQDPRWAAAGLR